MRFVSSAAYLRAGIVLAGAFVGVPHPPAHAAEFGAKASFENWIVVPPASNPLGQNSSSAVFFGGSSQAVDVPGVPGARLSEVSFGQPVAGRIPYPGFIQAAMNEALGLLYYEHAASEADRGLAAFRYKALLYGKDAGQTSIRARFENMTTYWNDASRDRANQAAQLIRNALRYAPWDRTLRNALLDIYYDAAVAELALAREKTVKVAEIALEIEVPRPGQFLIDREIQLLEEALSLYRFALERYMTLMSDPLGVATSEVSDGEPEQQVPFGYYLLSEEVPKRSLLSPLFADAGGNLVLPIDAGAGAAAVELFEGYKDLVLLLDIERDYVRTATDLARRYILRGNPATPSNSSDFDKARETISDASLATYVEINTLLKTFPDVESEADSASGARESLASWRHEVSDLGGLKSYLDGETNLLGFADDFLVLPQSNIPGGPSATFFDAYDFLYAYLTNNAIVGSPLVDARADFERAKANYDQFRVSEDQLALQFSDKNELYRARLRALVGVNPDQPGYDQPNQNVGSEIWQQANNIELARLAIERNQQEIENLQKEIEIEVWRRGQERGLSDAMSTVYVRYGDMQASLTNDIAKINADQVFANNIAAALASVSVSKGIPDGFSVSTSMGLFSYTANAFFQRDAEKQKGRLQAKKERLAASERAEIQSLQRDLLDVNSRAQIKSRLLQMAVLSLASSEAAINLSQEFGRLTALVSEKEDLERRMAETNELLANRYFADPSHRLTKDSSVLRADLSFQNAQLWAFFAVRAWEYKWNQKFQYTYGGKTYTAKTLFKLRNARELSDMLAALNQASTLIGLGARNDDSYYKFSYRQDVLGYRSGPSAQYHDPVTGALVDPITAFKSYVSQRGLVLDANDPENPLPGIRVLKLNFSTAVAPPAGGFFSTNRWLEKINYLRIRVLGGVGTGINSTVEGYLSYGGTALVRNQTRGTRDPLESDRWIDEATSYSTSFWYYQGGRWNSKPAFGAPATLQVSTDPEVPPTVPQINSFRELSVAASDWTLYVPIETSTGTPIVTLSGITDVEIHFHSFYYVRN